MEISRTYAPQEVEQKQYDYWIKQGFFKSSTNPRKEPFVVVIPPPNVTGVLHMGHMLNNTIQDVLVRKARMQGKEAVWVPGTDHASIATEARVVAMLKEKGIEKHSLTREAFLEHAWEWRYKYGGIILEQLRRLGASCDWDRTHFTMDEAYYKAVIEVFVDLYKKGKIYRGVRMVNWDPAGLTALSDEEVYHKEVQSKLVYINYPLADGSGHITIATTRPETIMADVAISVNPEDERYKTLVGKTCVIPLINKEIPIIADSYVDPEFGTGCLKVTPAHDINDYEIGLRHNLQVIDILNDDGTLNEKAQIYVGQDRFAVRKAITLELQEKGYCHKVEEITNSAGFSERTHAVVEPKLSLQWFLKMKELSEPALEAVMNDEVKLHPPKFKNIYRVWMENVRDWCISRQLWWGQRIPAYYLPDGKIVVESTPEKALEAAKALSPNITLAELKQDEDVLDTWFSSWLWPMEVFKGITEPDNEEFKYYYPTNDLVTAPEILFFWVARMIIAGYEYTGKKPFTNVYLTGIVRDKQGRKMSKSLGNSPDPIDLIEKYSADGVRVGMLFSSPAGNDLPFDEKLCEQGRNFANKMWNALRLVKGWEVAAKDSDETDTLAINWMRNQIAKAVVETNDLYSKYRISEALLACYKLVWEDFCAWYLEMIKPNFGEPISEGTLNATLDIFEDLMKIIHPFMPFISEEIWQNLRARSEADGLVVAAYPEYKTYSSELAESGKRVLEGVSQIRAMRNSKGLSPKERIPVYYLSSQPELFAGWSLTIGKLAGLESFSPTHEAISGAAVGLTGSGDRFFWPQPESENKEQDRDSLLRELEYTEGFLASVNQKLANEKFVANAKPELIERERKKQADAIEKIKALQDQLQPAK